MCARARGSGYAKALRFVAAPSFDRRPSLSFDILFEGSTRTSFKEIDTGVLFWDIPIIGIDKDILVIGINSGAWLSLGNLPDKSKLMNFIIQRFLFGGENL